MKKLKLLTSLSTLTVLSSAIAITSTSCSNNAELEMELVGAKKINTNQATEWTINIRYANGDKAEIKDLSADSNMASMAKPVILSNIKNKMMIVSGTIIGQTQINITATDIYGNTIINSFPITVLQGEDPTPPADPEIEIDGDFTNVTFNGLTYPGGTPKPILNKSFTINAKDIKGTVNGEEVTMNTVSIDYSPEDWDVQEITPNYEYVLTPKKAGALSLTITFGDGTNEGSAVVKYVILEGSDKNNGRVEFADKGAVFDFMVSTQYPVAIPDTTLYKVSNQANLDFLNDYVSIGMLGMSATYNAGGMFVDSLSSTDVSGYTEWATTDDKMTVFTYIKGRMRADDPFDESQYRLEITKNSDNNFYKIKSVYTWNEVGQEDPDPTIEISADGAVPLAYEDTAIEGLPIIIFKFFEEGE